MQGQATTYSKESCLKEVPVFKNIFPEAPPSSRISTSHFNPSLPKREVGWSLAIGTEAEVV